MKTVRITKDNADYLVQELGRLRFMLIEANAENALLREERDSLIAREVALTVTNNTLRTEIEEVAAEIMALNARLTALIRQPSEDSEPGCWFQIFPAQDWGHDVLAVQTSNEHDNWEFLIPLTQHNAVLLCHILGKDGGIPTVGVEVPQEWLYEALHEALDPISGDGEGSVAPAFLAWVDERTGALYAGI